MLHELIIFVSCPYQLVMTIYKWLHGMAPPYSADSFCDFRDFSEITKLNTRKFLELPTTMILSA